MEIITKYTKELQEILSNINKEDVEEIVEILENTRKNSNKVFVMGNGGSAAIALHFCCDLNKGTSPYLNQRYKVICLNSNISEMTAYSNDINYEYIFVEQLKNFAEKNDVVIGFSVSGNSKNVLRATEYANETDCITIGITNKKENSLKKLSKKIITIPTEDTEQTEDIAHVLCHIIKRSIIEKNNKK